MLSDRIKEDHDWRDGMNAFRLYIRREIEELKKRIEHLERSKNGTI